MFVLVTALSVAAAAATSPASPELVRMLRHKDQALLDATAPGDRATWDKTLSADAVYVDENGAILDRATFLKELEPLGEGVSGHISIVKYDVRVRGSTALVVEKIDERENYYGQELHADYLLTETWFHDRNDWRLALVHAYVVAKDPPALTMAPAALQAYAGHYTLMKGVTYDIKLEQGHLAGSRDGKTFRTLLCESPDVFFVAGQPRIRKVFSRDAHSNVISFVDRREGEDVIWTRGTSN
jgi:hypothetical protein